MVSEDIEYIYDEVTDFEEIRTIVHQVLDSKVKDVKKKRHLQYLNGLLEFGSVTDEVKAEFSKYAKFFFILLHESEYDVLVARLLCTIASAKISKWEVELVRNVQAKTGKKVLKVLLRQIQLMRPDLVREECKVSGRVLFPKLPKKIVEQFEIASVCHPNQTFKKITDPAKPPPSKVMKMDLIHEELNYAEIDKRKGAEVYLNQVQHFCDFKPLMPTLKLPNVIASCLQDVNIHPIVATKLTERHRSEFNRWIYLTLENELLQSRSGQPTKKQGIGHLLRLLKRFVSGTGVELPGLFVILAEFLSLWDGVAYRSEVFHLLPQIPLKVAEFEEIKNGICVPLIRIAERGDSNLKAEVIECIGKLVVNLRYKSYRGEKSVPELTGSGIRMHYKMVAVFEKMCTSFLAEVSVDYKMLDQMLMEFECIAVCETRTMVPRFSVISSALRLSILSSRYLDLVAALCDLYASYFKKVTPSADQKVQDSMKEIQSELKQLLVPDGHGNLANHLCFVPVIAVYAKHTELSLQDAISRVQSDPSVILPTLHEEFPSVAEVLSNATLSK